MKKIAIAILAVMAAAPFAYAQGDMDFDGKGASAISFGDFLKKPDACAKQEAACPAPAVEKAIQEAAPKKVKVNIAIKTGDRERKEVLACNAAPSGAGVTGCVKQSDAAELTMKDVDAMSLRKYFPADSESFAALVGQTRHNYTNQSGPQTFRCVDYCATWVVTSQDDGTSVGGSNGGSYSHTNNKECAEWTHSCTCIKNCY